MHTASSTGLRSLLVGAVERAADATALVDGPRRFSFASLHATACGFADRLAAAGCGPGQRVLVVMANSADFVVVFWATQLVGATFVPINPETKLSKLAWLIADSQPKIVVADPDLIPAMQAALAQLGGSGSPAPDVMTPGSAPDAATALVSRPTPKLSLPSVKATDLALIIYTSGSTGTPKGVMLTQRNVLSAARAVHAYLQYDASDKVFCAIPFSFDYGLHQVTMSALAGSSLIVERDFSRPVVSLKRIVEARATVVPIVPTMGALMLPFAGRFDLSSVRIVTNTAAALHPGLIDDLRRMLPGVRLFSMYGVTECHRCTYLDPAELDRRKSSVGKAIPGTELWVLDANGLPRRRDATGELVIRGDTVMQGYWNNPGASARRLQPGPLPGELVLHTGDICRLDEDGFVYFVERLDNMLKVRGQKVAPAEIEASLAQHPAVALAAIVGVAGGLGGARMVAFVERRLGQHVSVPELRAWCIDRLEPHLRPAAIQVLDALPRTLNGKIDRDRLRDRAASDEPRVVTQAPELEMQS